MLAPSIAPEPPGMDAQARIEQMVVIALLLILAIGCFLVLRPFLSALLWALILSFSTWPLYDWLVRVLGRPAHARGEP